MSECPVPNGEQKEDNRWSAKDVIFNDTLVVFHWLMRSKRLQMHFDNWFGDGRIVEHAYSVDKSESIDLAMIESWFKKQDQCVLLNTAAYHEWKCY